MSSTADCIRPVRTYLPRRPQKQRVFKGHSRPLCDCLQNPFRIIKMGASFAEALEKIGGVSKATVCFSGFLGVLFLCLFFKSSHSELGSGGNGFDLMNKI